MCRVIINSSLSNSFTTLLSLERIFFFFFFNTFFHLKYYIKIVKLLLVAVNINGLIA